MKHEVKILPQYFCRVEDGSKTFEIRINDRGYQPGDEIVLREYNPQTRIVVGEGPYYRDEWKEEIGYTGGKLTFKIGYVFPLGDNTVVFSLITPTTNQEAE